MQHGIFILHVANRVVQATRPEPASHSARFGDRTFWRILVTELPYLLATPSGFAERQYPFGGQKTRLCHLTAWVFTHFPLFPKRQFLQRIQLFFSSDSHLTLAVFNHLTTFALSAHQSRLCTIQ